MDAAKAAISKFTSHGGTHETSVDETVNPAVTSETIMPTRHEETQEAIDKEVHQDHYHTTIQPLQHREVLPERHEQRTMPVQEREFQHGDSAPIMRGVQEEQSAFRDTSQVMDTAHSSSQAAAVTGEHIHHHVHETVQPILHKEVIQPEVVHTTIPIHERHQAPSEHHGMSTMPIKSLDDFKSSGVPLTGTGHRSEQYEGDPRHYNPAMQIERHDVDVHPERHDGMHEESGGAENTVTQYRDGLGESGYGAGASTAQTGALRGAEGTGHGLGSNTGSGLTSGTGATDNYGTGNTGYGAGQGLRGNTGMETSSYGAGNTGRSGDEYSSRDTTGVTPAHNLLTGDHSSRETGGYGVPSGTHTGIVGADTTSHTRSHDPSDSAHTGHHHVEGHGTSNQIHHGSALDNTSRDESRQGETSRDPAMIDDKSDKKLTGTGVDGSHSAFFGLTPDGHKYKDTSSKTTAPHPAHGGRKDEAGTTGQNDKDTVAGQLNDPSVSDKGHSGKAEYDEGVSKPGAGTTGGSQGFGEVRPQDHGASSQMQHKLDPSTDADGDGKKGIMD